jgi:hypothetical protein
MLTGLTVDVAEEIVNFLVARCSVCGTIDRRKILLIPQTDRQMRQGRQW